MDDMGKIKPPTSRTVWESYDGSRSRRALMRMGQDKSELLALVMSTPFGWIACRNDGVVDGYYKTEAFAKEAAEAPHHTPRAADV